MCYEIINYYSDGCPHYYNTLDLRKCATAEARKGKETCERLNGVWAKVDKACRTCRNDPIYTKWEGYPMLGSRGQSPVEFDLAKTLKEVRYEPYPDGVLMKPRKTISDLPARQKVALGEKSGQTEKGARSESGEGGCCVCM